MITQKDLQVSIAGQGWLPCQLCVLTGRVFFRRLYSGSCGLFWELSHNRTSNPAPLHIHKNLYFKGTSYLINSLYEMKISRAFQKWSSVRFQKLWVYKVRIVLRGWDILTWHNNWFKILKLVWIENIEMQCNPVVDRRQIFLKLVIKNQIFPYKSYYWSCFWHVFPEGTPYFFSSSPTHSCACTHKMHPQTGRWTHLQERTCTCIYKGKCGHICRHTHKYIHNCTYITTAKTVSTIYPT